MKVCSMSQGRLFVWKSHWKALGWACKLGGVSGNHQGRANGINHVDGDSDIAPACQLCVGMAQ